MTNDTRQPAIATKGEDTSRRTRRWLSMTWNEADSKVAIITVGGTVLGGLLLVVMLGLALAVAHWAIKHLDLAVTVLASVNALAGIIASRALDSRSRIPKWAAYGGFVAVFSFTVLAVVGYAAGIHYS